MENKDKLLDFIIMQPSSSIWKKSKGKNAANAMQLVADEYKLGTFDSRALAQKIIHLTIYEEALYCKTTEELEERVAEKLKGYNYATGYVISKYIKRKGFEVNNDLLIYQNWASKKNAELNSNVLFWVVDIACFYLLNTGYAQASEEELINVLNEKLKPLIPIANLEKEVVNKFSTLKWDKSPIRKIVSSQFELRMDTIKMLYNAWFEPNTDGTVKKAEEEQDESLSLIDSLIVSICDIDQSAAEKEQQDTTKTVEVVEETSKENECETENTIELVAETVKESITEEEIQSKDIDALTGTESALETEEVSQTPETELSDSNMIEVHLKNLCESLGYTLVKQSPYLKTEDKETEILKNLLDYRVGAPLSQLYNTYKSIQHQSVANIEAVLSTFFTSLESLGVEFNETNHYVGEKLVVHTTEAGKEFKFSKPVANDGEIEVVVEYLETLYHNKRLTQMVVKPEKF